MEVSPSVFILKDDDDDDDDDWVCLIKHFLEDFDETSSPRDIAVDIARSRVVQHLVELRFVCGRPAC